MFYGHHAKPVCLAWAPDNEHFATGGMDMMVFVWDVCDGEKRVKIPGTSLFLLVYLFKYMDAFKWHIYKNGRVCLQIFCEENASALCA